MKTHRSNLIVFEGGPTCNIQHPPPSAMNEQCLAQPSSRTARPCGDQLTQRVCAPLHPPSNIQHPASTTQSPMHHAQHRTPTHSVYRANSEPRILCPPHTHPTSMPATQDHASTRTAQHPIHNGQLAARNSCYTTSEALHAARQSFSC